jgi:hypothetical protein
MALARNLHDYRTIPPSVILNAVKDLKKLERDAIEREELSC